MSIFGGLKKGKPRTVLEPTAAERCAGLAWLTVQALREAAAAELLEPGQATLAIQCARLIEAERAAWQPVKGNPAADADWVETWQHLSGLLRNVQLANRISRMRLYSANLDKLLMGVKRKTFRATHGESLDTYKPEFFEERLRGPADAESPYVKTLADKALEAFSTSTPEDSSVAAAAVTELFGMLDVECPIAITFEPRPEPPPADEEADADGSGETKAGSVGAGASPEDRRAAVLIAIGGLLRCLPGQIAQSGYAPARDLGEKTGRFAIKVARGDNLDADADSWPTIVKAIRNFLRMTILVYEPNEEELKKADNVSTMRHRIAVLKRLRRAVYLATAHLETVVGETARMEPDELLEKERRSEVLDNRAPPFPEVLDALLRAAMSPDADGDTARRFRLAGKMLRDLLRIEQQQVFKAKN